MKRLQIVLWIVIVTIFSGCLDSGPQSCDHSDVLAFLKSDEREEDLKKYFSITSEVNDIVDVKHTTTRRECSASYKDTTTLLTDLNEFIAYMRTKATNKFEVMQINLVGTQLKMQGLEHKGDSYVDAGKMTYFTVVTTDGKHLVEYPEEEN